MTGAYVGNAQRQVCNHHNMMKSAYNIRFEDFWSGFDPEDNFITAALRERLDINVLVGGGRNPDIMFYSNFGDDNLRWRDCIRIYVTGEADIPDFNLCDYAIGLAETGFGDRYLRFPFFFHSREKMERLQRSLGELTDSEALSRDFCSVLISNVSRDPIVFEFYDKLNGYKRIASGGSWNNTVGRCIGDKYSFINSCKFHIAFENTMVPGYVTEKILDSLIASSVPIYWGASAAKEDFAGRGFINISDFDTLDEAVNYIIEVDNNDGLYMELLNRGRECGLKTFEDIMESLSSFLAEAVSSGKRVYNDRGIHKRLYDRQYIMYKKLKASRPQVLAKAVCGRLKHMILKVLDWLRRFGKRV